jgi:hypothetical protein
MCSIFSVDVAVSIQIFRDHLANPLGQFFVYNVHRLKIRIGVDDEKPEINLIFYVNK